LTSPSPSVINSSSQKTGERIRKKMAPSQPQNPYFQRLEKARIKKVGDDLALYVPEQRAIHVLNQTALFIWECLKEPATLEELLFMLTEAFEGEKKAMEKDLGETIDLLLKNGLVRRVE
jgi:hypothetical protein